MYWIVIGSNPWWQNLAVWVVVLRALRTTTVVPKAHSGAENHGGTAWGPDLRAQLSDIVVLLTVFFSTFIMFTPCILLFKSELKCICAEIYVLKKPQKIENRKQITCYRKWLSLKSYAPNFLGSFLHFSHKKTHCGTEIPIWGPNFRSRFQVL